VEKKVFLFYFLFLVVENGKGLAELLCILSVEVDAFREVVVDANGESDVRLGHIVARFEVRAVGHHEGIIVAEHVVFLACKRAWIGLPHADAAFVVSREAW